MENGKQTREPPSNPISLQEQSFLYLASHLEEYPPNALALLPQRWRKQLLRVVSPVHLYQLEQSSVAEGIDTDEIWAENSQLHDSVWASYGILDSIEDSWRDCFFGYICHLLFNEKNRRYAQKRISQLLFGVNTEKLDRDTTESLTTHMQSMFIAIPPHYLVPFRCSVSLEPEIALLLIRLGTFPKVVEISTDNLAGTQLWRRRENGLLGYLLSEVRSIKINSGYKCYKLVPKYLLKTLVENKERCKLEWLQLWDTDPEVITETARLFSHPDGYQGLKKFELCTRTNSKLRTRSVDYTVATVGGPLASILSHQLALESVTLSGLHVNNIVDMQVLCTALAMLFLQPQFETLRIQNCQDTPVPLEAIQLLVGGFLASSPTNQQHLYIENTEIIANPVLSSFFPAPIHPEPNKSRLAGLRKHLHFINVKLPTELINWFHTCTTVRLNTFEFHNCRCVNGSVDFDPESPNFYVKNFRFDIADHEAWLRV